MAFRFSSMGNHILIASVESIKASRFPPKNIFSKLLNAFWLFCSLMNAIDSKYSDFV